MQKIKDKFDKITLLEEKERIFYENDISKNMD